MIFTMSMNERLQNNYEEIKVLPIAGALGAEIENVNLSQDISETCISEIYNALLDYQVIFFRNQKFDPSSQKAFAEKIGKPIVYPFVKSLEDFPESLRCQLVHSLNLNKAAAYDKDWLICPKHHEAFNNFMLHHPKIENINYFYAYDFGE